MHHNLRITFVLILMSILPILSACTGMTVTPSIQINGLQVPASTQMILPCEACNQATYAAALTQEKFNAEYLAAATAEMARANAQATLNSANATLSAAQTQEQNNTNIIVAQIAATVEVARANAQATLFSAGATQSAALTQDSIRQTQMSDMATTSAQSLLNQQNINQLAASTQTAISDNIATQTQAAAATSQWYADQARQREEQRQGPVAFLWMWCFPIFVLLLAVLILWAIWRWQKLQSAKQHALENSVNKFSPVVDVKHEHDDSLPYLETDILDNRYQVVTPDDQVHQWLDEVKTQLLESDKLDHDKKDENDNPDN